ncbi:aminoglycoside phosphotransferase family protein [Pseudooceanicola algae]|uniref:N-acetylmuramate/N-acetylglucosamine kinase n=1 Tax=Pseudooceanicola algae TaxID=1537215 RepID=A0A418SFL6_9RHOB|nr:phosphotransferase [Pseudooceanicola algae]QPM91496.1 N-acetylmuramate/N-acetylglucosamine kinase [Pseudooceanicola algae]
MSRQDDKLNFIAGTEWAGAQVAPLAGDASMRKYDRLTSPDGGSAVLMDAPPEKGEDVRPFVRIARHLTALGLSAPQVLAADEARGFLLLEDLGDGLFARVVADDPALEVPLYTAAVEALIALHSGKPPKGTAPYDPPLMTQMAVLAHEWYAAGVTGELPENSEDFTLEFNKMLRDLTGTPEVLILRDYHAENLLWLPERDGVARVGQLDFQDAMLGHRAYDLVSLLQDARRDVPADLEEAMIAHFTTRAGLEPEAFRAAYDLLSVQRNLRILGVFARLSMAYGRAHYVDLIPRVWGYLLRSLDRPGMDRLRKGLMHDLPAPTPEALKILKDKCATCPLP